MEVGKGQRKWDREKALLQMAGLCARSEQCVADVKSKLRLHGLGAGEIEEVVNELYGRGFLDDNRFARAFARDKVRFSGWGKLKIRAALKAKGLDEDIVREGLDAVDARDYNDAVSRAAVQKSRGLDLREYDSRLKLYKYLLSKGFEPETAKRQVGAEAKRQLEE